MPIIAVIQNITKQNTTEQKQNQKNIKQKQGLITTNLINKQTKWDAIIIAS